MSHQKNKFCPNDSIQFKQKLPSSEIDGQQIRHVQSKPFKNCFIVLVILTLINLIAIALLYYQVSQISANLSSNNNFLPKVPVTYIWLGSSLPNKYQNKLKWITYPYELLNDTHWEKYDAQFKQFNLTTVQKADLLRMFYLYENGGFYADLDVVIDYACLMKNIQKLKDFHLIGDEHWKFSNGLMIVDQAFSPKLGQLINVTIDKIKTDPKRGARTGPWQYEKLQFLQKSPYIDNCVIHNFDQTWNKDSNRLNDLAKASYVDWGKS